MSATQTPVTSDFYGMPSPLTLAPVTVRRNMRGELEAKHEIKCAIHGVKALIVINTSKSTNGVKANASVFWPTADGIGKMHRFGFGRTNDDDFRKDLVTGPKRATEKAIAETHVQALTMVGILHEWISEFYADPASVFTGH